MFLPSLVKLNNYISVHNFKILPQNSGACPKKRSLRHSSSISVHIFRFLVAKWVLLAETPRGPETYFAPFSVRRKRASLPSLPKIDASAIPGNLKSKLSNYSDDITY